MYMTDKLLKQARDYVIGCRERDIIAIHPVGLSRELSCTLDEACSILSYLQKTEQLVERRSFVVCPFCTEYITYISQDDCYYCQTLLPEEELEVQVRFYLNKKIVSVLEASE